jgi:hypothetical protein
MPRRLSPLPAACVCSTTLALLLAAAGLARAQKDDRKVILPPDGEPAFKSPAYKAARERFEAIRKPAEGEKANKDSKEDQAAVDWMAQYYTYRITWDGLTADPGGANKLMDEFNLQVNSATSAAMRQGNPAFGEMYLKALALRARDVIQTRQQLAAVNGARMLARLTEAGSAEAGDACAEALEDAKGFLEPKARPGVQYYALQGLKNLLGLWAEAPTGADAPPVPPGRKEREARYARALVEVIGRKPPDGAKPTTPDEVKGLQVFRREAVRALAQYRAPAVADDKGVIQEPNGATALALLKVVNNDGLAPPARLDEQIEAGIGVARLRSKALASYQPDYAAQQLGYLVVEMASRAQKNDKTKFPWKLYAARFSDALEALRADAKGHPDKAVFPYVSEVVSRSLRVVKDIELNESGNGGDLKLWLGNNPPPSKTLYKGVANSTVRPLEKGEDEPAPEKPAGGDKKPDEKKPTDKKPDDKKPMPGKP